MRQFEELGFRRLKLYLRALLPVTMLLCVRSSIVIFRHINRFSYLLTYLQSSPQIRYIIGSEQTTAGFNQLTHTPIQTLVDRGAIYSVVFFSDQNDLTNST